MLLRTAEKPGTSKLYYVTMNREHIHRRKSSNKDRGILRMQAPNGDRDKNAEAQERRIKVHAILSGERLAHFEKYLIETSGVRNLTDEQIAQAARRMLYEWIDHLVIEP